ncbi:MAG: hypothetical protein IPH52_01320 [Leptospiraceae bacterium]|nr:hypothetical protein [Leptospiraceae bacterium]
MMIVSNSSLLLKNVPVDRMDPAPPPLSMKFINNPSLEKLDRYSEELTANSLNNIKIGTISIYGNAINEFDKGFLRSFGEKLNTAILSFNRRKYYREIELLTNNLNAIIGDDSTSITEKRTQIIKEVLFRIQAKEAHFIMIKDGSIPTIESVKMEDLEMQNLFMRIMAYVKKLVRKSKIIC